MKPDMKIGVMVGVAVVGVLLVIFVMQAPPKDEVSQVDAGPLTSEAAFRTDPVLPLPEPQVAEPPAQPVTEPDTPRADTESPEPEPPAPKPAPEVIEVVAPEPKPEPPPAIEPTETKREPRFYLVSQGDSLWEISQRYYDDGQYWKEIAAVNSTIIKNPAALEAGWRLKIPYPDEIASNQR